jgi:hypothetical protein
MHNAGRKGFLPAQKNVLWGKEIDLYLFKRDVETARISTCNTCEFSYGRDRQLRAAG